MQYVDYYERIKNIKMLKYIACRNVLFIIK